MTKQEKKQTALRWGKAAVGGRWGMVAWGISGASAMAVAVWGLQTVAIPLIMLKTASWGIWGIGVFKESRANLKLGRNGQSAPPRR
ncbi:hypothetical protein [Methylococcus geothermalis]|uniref:Uncharacterized protein n=1 Tax=Methylococcus geothermalis TaxID=2681310 RepID=A0A858Q4T9_9GAMM|nr:hypothetical protein [Methylococcus geothermalis]QJD28835.1 hypothetical protein GNH96_01895 [Methylococcus geothermalis]